MSPITRAEIQVPTMLPIHVPSPSGEAFSVGALFAAVAGSIFYLRRKLSRDGTEVIKDRAEGHLLTQYMMDREKMQEEHKAEVAGLRQERELAKESERKAWEQANVQSVENARLKSENEYQQRELARLTEAMRVLQVQFDEIKLRLERLLQGGNRLPGSDGLN